MSFSLACEANRFLSTALNMRSHQLLMGREGSGAKTKEFVRVKRSDLERILSLLSKLEGPVVS